MKVIKRDGRLEEFMIDKIRTSVARASDEAHSPLTDGDLNVIIERIMKDLNNPNKDQIQSSEIRKIVSEKLNYCGFKNVAKRYS